MFRLHTILLASFGDCLTAYYYVWRSSRFPCFWKLASAGFWKVSLKRGLLAPYLASPLGSLPTSPMTPTFPGLYNTLRAAAPWSSGPISPPNFPLPVHIRSNECSRCGRLYKTRKGLKHHIKNECGVEPRFQCSHCDWKFKQKAHLLRHMARKHTVSWPEKVRRWKFCHFEIFEKKNLFLFFGEKILCENFVNFFFKFLKIRISLNN